MINVNVYPTGTTIYNPDKCCNGYTVFPARQAGVAIIDMNGNVVRMWEGLHGFPPKLFPGGFIMGHLGERDAKFGQQDQTDLVQLDWEGNIVWKFDRYEFIEDPGQDPMWMARQHHDYQREGNPVGYFAPGMEPLTDKGNTLILAHKDVDNPEISGKPLVDDIIYEVTWEGDIVWEWLCSDHFDEYGFDEGAKNTLYRHPRMVIGDGERGDWMHINSMSVLGPNKWFEEGDKRFHPDNIIWDGRQSNIIAIIDKQSGKVVWQIGPDYDCSQALRKMGWIIGQHHAHMIPKGLPGEGNILVFDNGGDAGYGAPNPGSTKGINYALRDYSRVLEFNPVTLEVLWQYSYLEMNVFPKRIHRPCFYSPLISSAQRLHNGNTLITEGANGRLFEVTPDHETVWEYVCPYFGDDGKSNQIYRAYRVPYDWVPQLEKPEEIEVQRIDNTRFRVPGSQFTEEKGVIRISEAKGFGVTQSCASDIDDP